MFWARLIKASKPKLVLLSLDALRCVAPRQSVARRVPHRRNGLTIRKWVVTVFLWPQPDASTPVATSLLTTITTLRNETNHASDSRTSVRKRLRPSSWTESSCTTLQTDLQYGNGPAQHYSTYYCYTSATNYNSPIRSHRQRASRETQQDDTFHGSPTQ